MDAKELRIGNWVYWQSDFHKDGGFEDQITAKDFTHCDINNASPIPLTEQWVEKFGFLNGQKDNLRVILKSYNGYVKGRTYLNFCPILEKQPEYVHQLQNLYFALTGKELEIKETCKTQ